MLRGPGRWSQEGRGLLLLELLLPGGSAWGRLSSRLGHTRLKLVEASDAVLTIRSFLTLEQAVLIWRTR